MKSAALASRRLQLTVDVVVVAVVVWVVTGTKFPLAVINDGAEFVLLTGCFNVAVVVTGTKFARIRSINT